MLFQKSDSGKRLFAVISMQLLWITALAACSGSGGSSTEDDSSISAATTNCTKQSDIRSPPVASGRALDAIELALSTLKEAKTARRDAYQLFVDDEGDKVRVTLLPTLTTADLAKGPPAPQSENGPVIVFLARKDGGEIVRAESR